MLARNTSMTLQFKPHLRQEINDYLTITIAIMCYVFGFTSFILPHEITLGGTTGLGSVIFYATGWWKVQYTFFLANAVLLLIAIRLLEWRFCVKTIYSVVVLTISLTFVQWGMKYLGVNHPELFPAGFNEHVQLPIVLENTFMSTIFGSAIIGIGLGLVFLRNGSTGGTDIIAAIVNKYKDVSLGTLILLSDVGIITSSMLLPGANLEKLLYGYTSLIIVALMIDFVINSARRSVQFLIFSEHYDEIASAINQLQRGVTVLSGQGWYTKRERKVLIVLAKKRESPLIFEIIQSIDPKAFVSQTLAHGVFGDGFDALKAKGKKNNAPKATPSPAMPCEEATTPLPSSPQHEA